MRSKLFNVLAMIVVLSMVLGTSIVTGQPAQASPSSPASAPTDVVTVTVLHTNDFHGNLQLSGSNPGMARTSQVIEDVRTAVGADNVLLVDGGDQMQGTLLSNLFHGESTIDVYKQMGYDVATFGNHEFDWGQTVLGDRVTQAAAGGLTYVSANIVDNDTGDCNTAGWDAPTTFAVTPYVLKTVGTGANQATIAFIGVTTQETPMITIASATAGLCFKDPALAIEHYYPAMAAASDAIVVLSHLGNTDGGYGYGFPVYGDQTLAQKLADASMKPDLIIGGHSHTDLAAAQVVAGIPVVQAHYAGRKVGKATLAIDKAANTVSVTWERLVVSITGPENAATKAAIDVWANDEWYQSEINRVVGFTNVTLKTNYNGDSTMGTFVNDAIYNDLNNDADLANDVDMVFNNAGGLRADISFPPTTTLPFTLTHGLLYSVLPFGNQTIVAQMTGAQVVDLLNQSATLFKGALQVAGVRYKFYRYNNNLPGAQPWAWGAYDIEVKDRDSDTWYPIDANQTYDIATNEFLAPAGQDGYSAFKYATNISYWGDMLNGVERWVADNYTQANPYDGGLDGRITRVGDDYGGPIVPVTLLENSDSHGNLLKGSYVGMTQLATLVNQERAKNPDRTLLLNAGDTIQGDAMSYYFKTAPTGYAADGTPIANPDMHIQPSIAAMNAMGYDAMTLGNHEFNFGKDIFGSVLKQADFSILGANVTDDGQYGLGKVPVRPFVQRALPGPSGNIYLGILGITNHRVPNYELPSNILGLSFLDPIAKAAELVPTLAAASDAVVALTHIGFTTLPGSLEVDNNVDTFLASHVSDIDVILGGHSHTDPNPATAQNRSYRGDYKYLPAIVGAPDGDPVLINHSYRYANYLDQVVLGFMPGKGGYDLVTRAGRYIKVDLATTPEDAAVKAIVQPYADMLAVYNGQFLGRTTNPIDALSAFTQETNGANLQADASVWELSQHGTTPDFHLSGAMTNAKTGTGATPDAPYRLKVSDMFTLMPYENSLVVLWMNGAQLKTVLERGYRNYWYYKYKADTNYGGYSHYTTCMLDTNAGNQIVYRDTSPAEPDGNNVAALVVNGESVDFSNTSKMYAVSTVNYLAAGSCNFNEAGVSLWPVSQLVTDTQLYVRDAVIDYVRDRKVVSPTLESRVTFVQAPRLITPAALTTGLYQGKEEEKGVLICNYDSATMDWSLGEQAAIPWLSEDTAISGSLAQDQCINVQLTFDSTGLPVGEYDGNLVVTYSVPNKAEQIIPVSMRVYYYYNRYMPLLTNGN